MRPIAHTWKDVQASRIWIQPVIKDNHNLKNTLDTNAVEKGGRLQKRVGYQDLRCSPRCCLLRPREHVRESVECGMHMHNANKEFEYYNHAGQNRRFLAGAICARDFYQYYSIH